MSITQVVAPNKRPSLPCAALSGQLSFIVIHFPFYQAVNDFSASFFASFLRAICVSLNRELETKSTSSRSGMSLRHGRTDFADISLCSQAQWLKEFLLPDTVVQPGHGQSETTGSRVETGVNTIINVSVLYIARMKVGKGRRLVQSWRSLNTRYGRTFIEKVTSTSGIMYSLDMMTF